MTTFLMEEGLTNYIYQARSCFFTLEIDRAILDVSSCTVTRFGVETPQFGLTLLSEFRLQQIQSGKIIGSVYLPAYLPPQIPYLSHGSAGLPGGKFSEYCG